MGRKPDCPASGWKIAKDTKTEELLLFHPSAQPEYSRTPAQRKRYQEIATVASRRDAEQFLAYKELGLTADAVAFLKLEHDVRQATERGTCIRPEELQEKVIEVQKETGRTCFGSCHSLDLAPACFTCYERRQETWSMCACIKSIMDGKSKH